MTLTEKQKALFPAWRAEWEGVALETAPADRRRAEDAIGAMYADNGLPPPHFIWVGSQLSAALAVGAIQIASRRRLWPIEIWRDHDIFNWAYFPEIEAGVPPDLMKVLRDELGCGPWWQDAGAFPRVTAVDKALNDHGEALRMPVEPITLEDDSGAHGDPAPDHFWSMREELWGEVRDDLHARLGEEICARIRDSAPVSGAYTAARHVRWPDVAAGLEPVLGRAPEGRRHKQTSAYRLALPVYCRDVLRVPCSDRAAWHLELWAEIARACDSWWAYHEICVVSDRPRALHWDDRDRLHHPSRPAIEYRDGTGVHLWHGMLVPSSWISAPGTIDPRLALTWPNIEQRRALAEIIGWQRVIAQLRPRVVDRDPDPAIGTLLQVHIPHFGWTRFLEVRCGTGRQFVLCVPPEMTTARQANAWTYGLESDEYDLEVRT